MRTRDKESPELARHFDEPNPQKITSLYEQRLRQFTDGGEYRGLYLSGHYDRDRAHDGNVELFVYSVPDQRRPLFDDAMAEAQWGKTFKGRLFGPSWSTHWFKIKVLIPEKWVKSDKVLFEWNSNDEGYLYLENGTPVQGLSGEHNRKEWTIPSTWRDNQWHTFYIETACNNIQGLGSPPDPNRYFQLSTADLVWPNEEARALYFDFWQLTDAAREMPNDSWQKHKAREIGNRIMDTFDPDELDESIAECREIAAEYLGNLVDGPNVYSNDNRKEVIAIGNCHIDTAWLWPYAETRRKIGRSWSSQLRLIEQYPEYYFVASQMQQFKWLHEDYPKVFDEVKRATKLGKFIPIGGTWTECDTNMPSGESFARQFLLGQRYLQANFNIRSKTFWLPDTFGYSPQIPQICRLAGQDRFLTQKLSWNNINSFPHSTFRWVGLDGSQVVCHMPPDNTYTAAAHFGDVARSLKQHKSLNVHQEGMLLFGYGDGGGGPTSEMLEKLRRCRGISDTSGMLPRVHVGNTVDDFFDKILENSENGEKLPTWEGELYLEYHRGTYTTQAAIKKGNRKSEVLMHDLEFVATLASLFAKNYKYPTKEIDDLWESICLNQFHDVLPGSGIEVVYEDARAIYEEVLKKGKHLTSLALKALGFEDHISLEKGNRNALMNTLPWGRAAVVDVHGKPGKDEAETTETKQVVVECKSQGLGVVELENDVETSTLPQASVKEIRKGVFVLENDKLRVTIEGGSITSLWDLDERREVLPEGTKGNQLVIFKDTPLAFPAWDTELFSLETRTEVEPGEVVILQNGPLRAAVQVEQKISDKSSITTTISLDAYLKPTDPAMANSSYLTFACDVDWHETYKFLKVEFPVDVRSQLASYETSFGYQQRPTHYNTTWDVAKFEVSAHKWADLSDNSYGAAILNDCKYGYSIHGNIMTLSLLRSPKSPDAHADMGKHSFRYAFLPHKGPLDHNVVRSAYDFNYPFKSVSWAQDVDMKIFRTFHVSGDRSLIVTSLKRFEDDEDVSRGLLPLRTRKGTKSLILRVYESLGGTARGYIHSRVPLESVHETNLLEDDGKSLDILTDSDDDDKVAIELKPFEIATYRLELA